LVGTVSGSDLFDSWQRPEWRAVRDDGAWEHPELVSRDEGRHLAWQHYMRQPDAVPTAYFVMSRPPPGYTITNGINSFKHRREDQTP
jgi:hypothetical protein